MEIAFADKNLRGMCLNESLAKQNFGVAVAKQLKNRLADFDAVDVVSDLFQLPGSARELNNELRGRMVVDLSQGYQLVFKSGHVEERLLVSGDTDWSHVRRILILGLGTENGHE